MQAVEAQFTRSIFLKWNNEHSLFDGGTEIRLSDGCCLRFEHYYPVHPAYVSEEQVRARLQRELTLVPGIGKTRTDEFRKRGITTLTQLKSTRFKDEGNIIAEIIETCSPKEIEHMFRDLHRGNDPLLLGFAGQKPEAQLFFDIETLGMAHSPIILFGIGEYTEGGLKVTQYLARNVAEELPALLSAAKHFSSETHVVSYNGKVFDIPYFNDRLTYYGERIVRPEIHFDLLFTTRKLFGKQLPNCCLGTVEEYLLHLPRKNDLPGWLVPEYYQRWLFTGKTSILKPIVKHNEADVAHLATLLQYQQELIYGS